MAGVGIALSSIGSAGAGSAIAGAVSTAAIGAGISAGISAITAATQETTDITGQRVESLRIQQQDEGAPIHYLLGINNRVAGTIIWAEFLPPESESHTTGDNKFGSGGVNTKTFFAYANVAVAVCEGPVQSIKRVWANGRLLVTPSSSTQLVDHRFYVHRIFFLDPSIIGYGEMELRSPPDAPDLTEFTVGEHLEISGFSHAGNNGSFRIRAKGTSESGITWLRFANFFSSNNVSTQGNDITLLQNHIEFAPNDMIGPPFIHIGDGTQAIDGLISGVEGTTDTPAYRHIAYAVFQQINLGPYGNTMPQLTFEVDQGSITVANAISSILVRGGMVAADFDVTDISGTLAGYVVSGPQSVIESLRSILIAYDIVTQDKNGVITFIHRGNEVVTPIDASDLAAHSSGSDTPRVISVTDRSNYTLPREIDVQFLEKEKDLQRGSQRERRVTDEGNDVTVTVNLPIVLTAGEARSIARRELWRAWIERQKVIFFLPPSYIDLEEHDVVTVTIDTVAYRVLVTELLRGDNFLLEVKGIIESGVGSGIATDPSELPTIISPGVFVPPLYLFTIFDYSSLLSEHANETGVYVAISRVDAANTGWSGAELWLSPDDDTYEFVESFPTEALFGIVPEGSSIIADGPVGYWDRSSFVEIGLIMGTLQNKTESEVLDGANWAMLGNEIIGYQNATLLENGNYKLTTLLRGLRDTDPTGHATGDRFVTVDSSRLKFIPLPDELIGETGFVKAVSAADDVDDADSFQVSFLGGTKIPFKPAHIGGQGAVNVIITWLPVSREFRSVTNFNPISFLETEQYEITIFEGVTATVARVATTSSSSYEYTVGARVADSNLAIPFNVEIRQVGQFGPGRALTGTIPV